LTSDWKPCWKEKNEQRRSPGAALCRTWLQQRAQDYAIFQAYQAGKYPYLPSWDYWQVFRERAVRFGAYGDPVHIPLSIIRRIARLAARHTGYTHQWRQTQYQGYRAFVMASVDNLLEFETARQMGWRTFRTRAEHEPLAAGEITCPASKEAGYRTQCIRCGLCDGIRGTADKRKDISIIAHGAGAKSAVVWIAKHSTGVLGMRAFFAASTTWITTNECERSAGTYFSQRSSQPRRRNSLWHNRKLQSVALLEHRASYDQRKRNAPSLRRRNISRSNTLSISSTPSYSITHCRKY
jgi:hypothetical protein